jgi:hypothetical protein
MGGRGRGTGYANYFRDYKRLAPFAKLPSNFPRSERCRSLSAASVFNVDELRAKGLGFALQIRQPPSTLLLLIRLLSRVNVGRAIPPQARDQPRPLLRGRRHGFGGSEP